MKGLCTTCHWIGNIDGEEYCIHKENEIVSNEERKHTHGTVRMRKLTVPEANGKGQCDKWEKSRKARRERIGSPYITRKIVEKEGVITYV